MLDSDVFVKTDAGRDEIRSRTLGLSMSVRAILLMIDGQRDVAAMRSIIAGSKAPTDVLDALESQGLIARVPKAPAATSMAPRAAPARAVAAPVAIAPARSPAPAAAKPVPSAAAALYSADDVLDLQLPTVYEAETADVDAEPAAAPVNRYEHLYAMMNEIVRDFLSPTRRYLFQLKIERATTSEELLELLHDLQMVLAKARGDAFASEVISRLRAAAD